MVSRKEKRQDVTALPYGAPTTALFGFLFTIMAPVYFLSNDPILTWKVGVAACFINGFIEVLGAFCGEQIRRITPRAALLGTLAGIAIAFIAMKPTLQVFARPQIGFAPLAIILLGFLAKAKMPGKLPIGLMAIIVGTIIAWVGGYMEPRAITAALSHVGFYYPKLSIGAIFEGIKDVGPYLAIIIPLATHNFMSTMQNVESAAAVGDSFDTKSTMLVDGFGTLVGSLFGSVLPTTVYIGHPGYKGVGARAGYSILNGIAITLICLFGLLDFINAIIPAEAVYVILLYIGLVITAQAFQSCPKKHAPAVAIALIPHLANFGVGLVNNAAKASGLALDQAGIEALTAAGVNYQGLSN
jgi:AGZA family xanthine/uracil permease-like MFS transporter